MAKMSIFTCVHFLYNNTNIKTKARSQHYQSSMCTYPLQQHEHKQKVLLLKFPVLHVYIPYSTILTLTQGIVSNIPVLNVYIP